MDEYNERLAEEISKLSKSVFISVFLFVLLSLLLQSLLLNWLLYLFGALFLIAFCVSWITPSVFILFGKFWLAHAWLRGINPIVYSEKSWSRLSSGTKIAVFIQSIIMSIAVLAFLYVSIMNSIVVF